jgi:iron complex transport system ATP-binding protein
VKETAFHLENVSAGYARRTVLHDVSLSVACGAWVGIFGPNGAGKTTLLRTLSGALRPSSGVVTAAGRDIVRWPARERARHVAYVPQSLHLPVPYTLHDLVAIGRTPHLHAWGLLHGRDEVAILDAVRAVDLEKSLHLRVEDLSEGERQRAVLAMALAQEPRILLLDEPTAHLDIQHAWSILKTLERLVKNKGLTVVMTSHDLNLAGLFCSDLVLLSEGRIAAQGAPADVLKEELLSRVYAHPLRVWERAGERAILPAGRG